MANEKIGELGGFESVPKLVILGPWDAINARGTHAFQRGCDGLCAGHFAPYAIAADGAANIDHQPTGLRLRRFCKHGGRCSAGCTYGRHPDSPV